LPEPWFVVITPPVHVSTAEIFSAPDLRRDSALITQEDFLAGRSRNDCEPVTCARYPQVREALEWLRLKAREAHDARTPGYAGAAMSGTGASVFLGFDSREQAEAVSAGTPRTWQVFVARGLNQSPLAGIMRAA
jgi:4-diphosphocytidyl-2-C-methyl-D-erythritol kinase